MFLYKINNPRLMKNKTILFLVIIIFLSNFAIVLYGMSDILHTNAIHLEPGIAEKCFLNLSETKSNQFWIYLKFNKTYSIEVDPSWNSSEADLYFNFNDSSGLIHLEDKVSKGSTERYKYHCSKSGNYYIEVFSDVSAHYTILVGDITHSNETCLIIIAFFLIYELYYIYKKWKKKVKTEPPKTRLGRFISNDIVQFIMFILTIFGTAWIILDFLGYV